MRYFTDSEVFKLRKALKADPDVKSIRALAAATGIDYWKLITERAKTCVPDIYKEIERRRPQRIRSDQIAQMALTMKLETTASWADIAKMLDCSRQHCQNMAKKLDVKGELPKLEARRKAEREQLRRQARRLSHEGRATREIAQELGQSASTINRWICHA